MVNRDSQSLTLTINRGKGGVMTRFFQFSEGGGTKLFFINFNNVKAHKSESHKTL